MDFFKYHALGNDYIVIDPQFCAVKLHPESIKLICHRHFGIGSDGILYGPFEENGMMSFRIFNPDGSEAEKSGNGIRIFAKYLVDKGSIQTRDFTLQTLGGEVTGRVLDDIGNLIKVDMGTVTFASDRIPVGGPVREVVDEVLNVDGDDYKMTCVSIGNPHCVIPMQRISPEMALELGPKVENHLLFPKRINVQLVEAMDRANIRIEIWERGAGYTMASGSSSCAAACAAFRLGLVDSKLKVHMPGGIIDIEIRDDGHVFMTGLVEGVGKGKFAPDLWAKLK